MPSGVKPVWAFVVISENRSPPAPPQKPVAKDSSRFGSHGKCAVGLDCVEFSSSQTVWVSGAPSLLTEGWGAWPTNPCGQSLGFRHPADLIPGKGVGPEREGRLLRAILGRTGWIAGWGTPGWSSAGSSPMPLPPPSSPACRPSPS